MPNYRKKKQSNSNKHNKNKNKNQNQNKNKSNTTSSSSVKQEQQSELESVGIQPNLPADVNFSSSIDTTTTSTSASVLDIEKGVVVGGDSSPSSNEEINENACNVDIDTCSSDTKTVLTQSNNLSSFCSSTSSSSKKLTEIERKSENTVFDGDSTIGNSVIIDTFQAGAGINSLKTGSAHTKDAAVPTAVKSATRSIKTARKSEGSVDENRLDTGGIRDESELATGSEDRATKVIVHEILKETSTVDRPLSRISSKDDQSPEVIESKLPQTITSKVIIHQISKEESPQSTAISSDPSSKEIVHQVEESQTVRTASKKNIDQSPKVITQQISKKKATRSNTSSLLTSRSNDDDVVIVDDSLQTISPTQQREQSSKVIVRQTSKGESTLIPKKVTFEPNPQEISKVIVHQISIEDSLVVDDNLQTTSHLQQQEQSSKAIVHQTSKDDSALKNTLKKVNFQPNPQEISKVILHQISKEDSPPLTDSREAQLSKKVTFDTIPQEISKVTIHKISNEGSVDPDLIQQSTSKVIVSKALSEEILHQTPIDAPSTPILTKEAVESPKIVVIPVLLENSTQTTSSVIPPFRENPLESLTQPFVTDFPTNSILEISQQPAQTDQQVIPPKEIFIPILVEDSTQTSPPVLPTSVTQIHYTGPTDLEEDSLPSTVIFEQISKDRSTEHKTSSHITEETSLPTKVIVHPILQEGSTQTESKPLQEPDQSNLPPTPPPRTAFPVCRSPKVIVHQISREGSHRPVFPFTPKSLQKLDHSSKKIANQILKDVSSELQSSFRAERANRVAQKVLHEPVRTSFPLSTKQKGPIKSGYFENSVFQTASNPTESNVIAFQVSREESKADQSTVNEIRDNLVSNDLEQKVIFQENSSEKSKSSRTSFPWRSPDIFPLSTQLESQGTIPVDLDSPPKAHESKVIVHQISQEEPNLNKFTNSTTASSVHSTAQDRTAHPDSAAQSTLSDLQPEPKSKSSRTSFPWRSPDIFPLSTQLESQGTIPVDLGSPPKAHESKVIVHQISQEESNLNKATTSTTASSVYSTVQDQTTQSDAAAQSTLSDLQSEPKSKSSRTSFPWRSPDIFPLSSQLESQETIPEGLNSKVIVHQISQEELNLNKATTPTATSAIYSAGQDQTTLSDSTTQSILDDLQSEPKSKSSRTSFPWRSPDIFPLSSQLESQETIPEGLDSKVIVHQISQEELNLNKATTSKATSAIYSAGQDQTTHSDLAAQSILGDLQSEPKSESARTSFPWRSPDIFPLSTQLENQGAIPVDLGSPPKAHESKVIVHQISQEEPNLNKFTTSTTASSVHSTAQDRTAHSDSAAQSTLSDLQPEPKSKSSRTSFPWRSPDIFPLSTQLESQGAIPVDLDSPPKAHESKVIVHQISQEEPNLNKSTTSTTASSVHSIGQDPTAHSDSAAQSTLSDLQSEPKSKSSRTSFPWRSPDIFPLSTQLECQEVIPVDLGSPPKAHESRVIVHQISQEESNLNKSTTSTATSAIHSTRQDQTTHSDSTTQSILGDLQPEPKSKSSRTSFPWRSPDIFPLSTQLESQGTIPEGLDSKVIVHQISQEESNLNRTIISTTASPLRSTGQDKTTHSDSTIQSSLNDLQPEPKSKLSRTSFPWRSPDIFPLSTQLESQGIIPVDSNSSPKSPESKVIVHQISQEESNLNKTTTYTPTSAVHSTGQDRTTLSDSTIQSPLSDLQSEPKSKLSRTSFPWRSPDIFPLSTQLESQGTIPVDLNSSPKALELKVIVHQISQEESNFNKTTASTATSARHLTGQDQTTHSDSTTQSTLSDLQSEPKSKLSRTSFPWRSPDIFPLSSQLEGRGTIPVDLNSAPKTLESTVIVHQISREDFRSSQSNFSGKLPHDSSPSTRTISHETSFDTDLIPKDPESKGIVHQISREELISNQSAASPLYPGRKVQTIYSNSTTKLPIDDVESNVIVHQISQEESKSSHARFPVSSSPHFPLSTVKKRQPTATPEVSESKVIEHRKLRKESKSIESSSISTSSLLDSQGVDQRIQSDSGTKVGRASLPVNFPLGFPLSTHKQRHEISSSKDVKTKVIEQRILREKAKSTESSSTLTSSLLDSLRKDQRILSDSGTKKDLKDNPISTEEPKPSKASFAMNFPPVFPLSECAHRHEKTPASKDLQSKVIEHQILIEKSKSAESNFIPTSSLSDSQRIDQRIQSDSGNKVGLVDNRTLKKEPTPSRASLPVNFPLGFPLSTHKQRHEISSSNDVKTKVIEHRILREKAKSTESSSTLTSSHLDSLRKDQRILSDSGTKKDLKDNPISTEEPKPSKASFAVNFPPVFPLSECAHRHEKTPASKDLQSKVIEHQILIEKSKSAESNFIPTSSLSDSQRIDQRIQSDSGNKVGLVDNRTLKKEPTPSRASLPVNFPLGFPLSTHKQRHEISSSNDVKTKVIEHRILREKAKSTKSSSTLTSSLLDSLRKDQRILSDSGTKKDLKDNPISTEEPKPSKASFAVNFPPVFPLSECAHSHEKTPASKDLQSKVIEHQILIEKSKSAESNFIPTSSLSDSQKIDQRIQSDSGTKSPLGNIEPNVITHQILGEGTKSSHTSFPVKSTPTFPLSTTHASKDLESKVVEHQVSHQQTKSIYQLSTEEQNQKSSSISGTETAFDDLVPSRFHSRTFASLPVSTEQKDQSTQFNSNSQIDLEPKVIVQPISPEEPKVSQPSSTSAPLLSEKDDQTTKVIVDHISPKESKTTSSPSVPSEKEVHAARQSKAQSELKSKQIDLQILREESDLRSTASILTSTEKKDQGTAPEKISREESAPPSTPPSSDIPPKVVDHQTSQDESVSSSSSSGESVLTTIQVKSPTAISPPVVNDRKEKQKPKVKSPRSSFFLTSAELATQTNAEKSDSSDTETLRGGSETPPEHEEEMSSLPDYQVSEVIVHQISLENPITGTLPEVISPKMEDHSIVRKKTPPETGRILYHPIVREIVTDKPLAYRVESPQPDRRLMIVKKSKSFDDDDIVIQEMSDNSSAGDTDNPPVISEAESETDTLEAIDDFPDTPINSRVLSVQTLPIDHEDDSTAPMSPKTAQDYKNRRQQNRVALESHFLPQFLSPMFLDSIKEENSDLSDSERRSECSDRTDHASQQGELEDDVFLEGGPHAKKANAVFPKSNLDFSKPHKHIHTNVRPPKTSVIREEAPPPSVVEAKIIDQGSSIDEFCSLAVADLTPQSEDAEVVYIDSASSSVSDLLELDYSEGQPDDTIDVRIQTPTIDLESVNEMFAYHPSESNDPPQSTSAPPPSPVLPPVKEEKENVSEKILSPPLTDRVETTNTLSSEITTKIQTAVEQKIPHDEIILEKIETMSETVATEAAAATTDRNNDDDDIAAVAAADRVQNSKANNPNSCDSAINEVVTKNDTPSAVAVGSLENMENLRDIVSAAAVVQSELDTITDTDRGIMKPNFKIGEPCSDHTFKCDTRATTTTTASTSSSTSSSSVFTTTTSTSTTTTTSGTQILTLHDLSKTLGDTQHLHPLGSTSSALDRQESLDSHGSDQSQSTNQSQCTAINQGSLPHCDWNEFDTNTDTTYVSGSDTAGLASSENSSPLTTGGGDRSADDTESPPIRKLRSLCTEALASMPYGEDVLEELATVAQNIGDMPYPLPNIPHIQDIQVSLRADPQKSSVITLAQVPPTSTPVGQKFKSPPPPPVPEPPSKYDSWFGVPTESDPSVLVCLSPSQRTAVKDDSTADSLLDMHKKFVERRGYHEYTTKQVNAMNREKSNETVKLSKSISPPPPPLPPRPQQQSSKSNGNETFTETDINADDQNNHRLLAIIRDTHESQQQPQHQQQRSENISRRTESTTNSSSTTTATNGGGGGQEEFANSPSVSKQTEEQRFVSESNQSQSAHHEMQTGQTERTIKIDHEPILGLRFPTSDYFDSIFDGKNKRFSNIETASSPGFCSQILNTQPKRYSNIETSSFESRKCVENGKVLYDVSDSNRSTVREGEKPDLSGPTSFPELTRKVNISSGFPYIKSDKPQVNSRPQTGDSEPIMSAFKLNTAPPPPVSTQRVESSPPAPPVPPLPPTLVDTTATATTSTTKSTSTSERSINKNFNGETKETIFDDFRQRAKEAAAGEQQQSTRKKSDVFDHEKLFKDFDELSNLLKDELESGKRRPPATFGGSEIPSDVSDYNRVARESKIQTSSSTSEHTRREQMKKLADEIDRTSAQRIQHRREMRIPIRIEKPTPTPPRSAPVQMENGTQTQRTFEIPVQIENGADTQRHTLQHQRSYDIPIRVEHQTGSRQRTRSEHQSEQRSHEAPIRVERPAEQPERFRRAESMFNISDTTSSRHMLHDDWMKYVGDLGSSENICKPFQREVEICYLGRRPNIRAPRLSASTSDLSSTQSYDTYGAYDVRRTTTTQTPRPQQPPRRRFLSTQSMIDTTPITPCVSSHRSPVPERRSSLPREIHDQQLKYITSKEQQLQHEFERLENERRALIDEMNRAQINQRINREAYRQRQLPPLTEDETIRQQMAEEWLNKVAEREERRLQKIIKISKINADGNFPTAPPRRVSSSDIGDEFLRRVKERRSKLHMPSDSDWESGAESQPAPHADGSRSENEEPPVTVLEGHSEADYKHLPKHLREFAKLTSQVKEEHREETTENTSCSAIKKSSVVTTVKTSNANNTANNYQQQKSSTQESSESLQQDAARVRDLEQLSQGKRQKLVTILRHKKPAESSSAGSCQQPVASTTVAVGAGPVPAGSSGSGGGGANSVKRRKQTRFLLTPNRRSWSESDLLREIDKELVLAKGFLYANGVWTPKNQTPSSSRTNLNEFQPYNTAPTPPTTISSDKISENRSSSACGLSSQKGIPTPPPPPLWTPQPERKQFRPVHFESPKLQRRYVRQQSTPSEAPPPPWSYTNSQPFPGYQSQSCTNLSRQKNTAIPWPPPAQNGGRTTAIVDDSVVDDEDDGFAPTTSIAEKIRSFERSTSNSELHRPFVRHNPHEKPAILRPNEVIYSLKNEYMSEPETEYEKPKKMAQLSRRQYDGIGPTTKDGMPVVLRSEVKEPNQHEWYKRIFQTIHKQKNPDDYVTIRYKCPRGRYPYKSNGYMSEPEPNYDSDYSTVKYRTLERRRLQSTQNTTGSGAVTGPPSAGIVGNDSQDDTVYGTMPNPVKSGQGSYKVQPGRIEDYITGHSSVSEKEKKEWWDEVMDIFNGWLKDNDTWPRVFIEFANEVEQFQLDQQKLSPHYTEGNLSRALLKEQGYTSDSNLVFRKKDVPQHQSPLSPVEQKQVYKSVQAGGQPPLLGFRKAAPEKPKDSDEVPPPPVPPKGVSLDSNGFSNLESPNRYFESDVNIHYKTPIRYEYKDPIPEEELAIRQAESMQKLYQEERRRKYLQELQDMNSRRHTDNFTPSQKSPIPLNRYDDFNSDLAPKSPNSSNYPKTIARALYNFQGQTARELTFKKGDVIYIRRQIDKNWYEGEHNAMIGLLPSNYVELITKDGVRQPPKKPSEGQARAKYNFQAQSGIELSLNKGEHVTLTRRVDDNWFEGKIANRKGIFPVSYVEVLVDIGAEDKAATRTPVTQSIITQSSSVRPSLDTLRTNINNEFNSLTSNGQPPNGILRETRTLHKTEVLHVDTNTEPVAYRALYKYRPQNTDELELQEGDIVYVLEKCDDGWFVGTSQRSGCFGTFPGNYVERV